MGKRRQKGCGYQEAKLLGAILEADYHTISDSVLLPKVFVFLKIYYFKHIKHKQVKMCK